MFARHDDSHGDNVRCATLRKIIYEYQYSRNLITFLMSRQTVPVGCARLLCYRYEGARHEVRSSGVMDATCRYSELSFLKAEAILLTTELPRTLHVHNPVRSFVCFAGIGPRRLQREFCVDSVRATRERYLRRGVRTWLQWSMRDPAHVFTVVEPVWILPVCWITVGV